MIEAIVFEENRQDDMLNQRASWVTAHIMNSSGNYKRRIKPTDLYKPMAHQEQEQVEQQEVVECFDSPEQKTEYLKNLMKKFGKELNTDGLQ
jgi:hypothetical protein